MSLTYITDPTGTRASNSSGFFVIEDGVTVDGTGAFQFILDQLNAGHLTAQIDGIASETDPGEWAISLDGNINTVFINTTGQVHAVEATAVHLVGSYNQVINQGLVTGKVGLYTFGDYNRIVNEGRIEIDVAGFNSYGIRMESSLGPLGGSASNSGVIISAEDGVFIGTLGGSFENSGKVKAAADGVIAAGIDVSIMNSGVINGGERGIHLWDNNGFVQNSGKIVSDGHAIFAEYESSIVNTGLIKSKGGTAISTTAEMEILNSGKIKGDVQLSDEADSYFAHSFGMVTGVVYGGASTDELQGAKADDRLDGGASTDLLYGKGGADVLVGGTESDFIQGGRGKDVLWGDETTGAGGFTDYFQFFDKKSGTDTIMDFEDGTDRIQLNGIGVVGELADLLGDALSSNGDGDAVLDLAVLGDFKGKIIFDGIDVGLIDTSDFQLAV